MKTQFAERVIFYGYEIKRKKILLYFQNEKEEIDFYIEQNKKEAKNYISKFGIENFLFCLELENFIIIENKKELGNEFIGIVGLAQERVVQKPVQKRQKPIFQCV